jgi:hypothetical protein
MMIPHASSSRFIAKHKWWNSFSSINLLLYIDVYLYKTVAQLRPRALFSSHNDRASQRSLDIEGFNFFSTRRTGPHREWKKKNARALDIYSVRNFH